MKKSILKGLLLILFSSTCFACTNGIEGLTDASIPVIDSSPALVAEVKATTHFLGWGNVGDTTIRVKADKEILPALPTTKPNIASITSNLEGGFRLLSVGGSLSAGFRDGGLYREGQLTAFPNLIARQMGVTFYQPLFDANEGNGSGYKTLAGTEPIATFKMVTNNLGYVDNKAEKFKKFNGSNLDNYAFPGMNRIFGAINIDNDKNGIKYSDRFINNPNKDPYLNNQLIFKETCDFFIFEIGLDEQVASSTLGGGGSLNATYYSQPTVVGFSNKMTSNKSKGILLTVPNILELPYYTQVSTEKLKKTGVKILVQRSSSSEYYRDFDYANDIVLPTAQIEKFLKGEIRGELRLKDSEVLSRVDGDDEWASVIPIPYNRDAVQRAAQLNNLPVLDIYELYKKILLGSYTTDDGMKVIPDWKTGNFFSADGIYPTAFGQAVIANEAIKTINQHYKLSIPLVDTKFFLKK